MSIIRHSIKQRYMINGGKEYRDDIYRAFENAPNEVQGVLNTLRAGRIYGQVFVDDEIGCGCLIGTIALLRHEDWETLPYIDTEDYQDAQLWFSYINMGDTPTTNEYAAKVEEWILEWQAAREAS